MDLQTLSNLFATTYSSDPNVQKTGELQIRKVRLTACSLRQRTVHIDLHIFPIQLGAQEGMLTALLQIIGNDNVELYVRLTRMSAAPLP